MSKWIVFYIFNGVEKFDIVMARHTMEAKEMWADRHTSDNVVLRDVEAYSPDLIQPTDADCERFRLMVASLV